MALEFYNAGLLRQIATNLFYGWGYNFYRKENQLRADDQLVRAQCILLLNAAARSVAEAESAYRREHLPPPSREKPRPDAEAVSGAQSLERLHASLVALAGRLTALPVPENDRMTQRFRQEAATLAALGEHDAELAGRCEMLRAGLEGKTGEHILQQLAAYQEGLASIDAALLAREKLLLTSIPPRTTFAQRIG